DTQLALPLSVQGGVTLSSSHVPAVKRTPGSALKFDISGENCCVESVRFLSEKSRLVYSSVYGGGSDRRYCDPSSFSQNFDYSTDFSHGLSHDDQPTSPEGPQGRGLQGSMANPTD
ncbi:MAG: hypothetical protein AAGG51_31065, partial [Cyanobacteria bacterium P01_G01_bin.54]